MKQSRLKVLPEYYYDIETDSIVKRYTQIVPLKPSKALIDKALKLIYKNGDMAIQLVYPRPLRCR